MFELFHFIKRKKKYSNIAFSNTGMSFTWASASRAGGRSPLDFHTWDRYSR